MTFLWLLEGIRTPFLDQLMQFITYFGQEIIIIAVICALYWCADKRFAYLLGFTYFTAGLCVQSLKITFRIPRPWVLNPDFHAVESAIPGATGYSFPSGHTQGATCLFFPLALKTRKFWTKYIGIPFHWIFQDVLGLPHAQRRACIHGYLSSGICPYLALPGFFPG